jgi:fibronectin type 3 domain-containing protein
VTAKAAAGGGIRLTWTLSGGATKYNVYRQTAGGEWEYVGYSRTNSFTDLTAASGMTYTYRVQAQMSKLYSAYSATASARRIAAANVHTGPVVAA